MTLTQEILERDNWDCAYCHGQAVQADHVIPRSVRPRLARLRLHVDNYLPLLDLVAACRNCNEAKGCRLLIPSSWEHRLDELNALGIGTFRVWRGDAESLRRVCK